MVDVRTVDIVEVADYRVGVGESINSDKHAAAVLAHKTSPIGKAINAALTGKESDWTAVDKAPIGTAEGKNEAIGAAIDRYHEDLDDE